MSVAIKAPWEGHTGYRTTLAWRYNGELQGDEVTLEEAVTKTKASACWEGVRSREVTMPIVVEKVRVRGVKKMVDGSIAFVPTTQSWLRPMREVWDGVLGSQDVTSATEPTRGGTPAPVHPAEAALGCGVRPLGWPHGQARGLRTPRARGA